MPPKRFKDWMLVKEGIHEQNPVLSFREQEIWWCSVGCNVGWEEDGKHHDFSRPILIIRKFTKELFWGVPLTSKLKSGHFYHQFTLEVSGIKNSAILSQVRTLDARRLIRKVGNIKEDDFDIVREKIVALIKTEAPYNKVASSGAY